MNCDCIKITEQEIAEHHRDRAGDDVKVTIKGRSIGLNSENLTLVDRFTIPVLIKGSGKGYRSKAGKETSIVCNYCPLCGTSTKPKPSDENE